MHPLHSPSSFGGRKVIWNEYVLLGIYVFCMFPHKSRHSLVKKWTVCCFRLYVITVSDNLFPPRQTMIWNQTVLQTCVIRNEFWEVYRLLGFLLLILSYQTNLLALRATFL